MRPLMRVSRNLLEKIYTLFADKLGRHGIGFATCKEGLFRYHTAEDCCGVYLLREYVLRATLYDVYRYIVETGQKALQPAELFKNVCNRYSRICLEQLKDYPKTVSKALRYHEKKMLKVLSNSDVLSHIAPHLFEVLKMQRSPD